MALEYDDPQGRFDNNGKEVLFDGRHFLDATSEDDAKAVAMILHYFGAKTSEVPNGDLAVMHRLYT